MTMTQLADELADAVLAANPVIATVLGVRTWDDKLPDFSEAGNEAVQARLRDILARAQAVDPAPLEAPDRVTRSVVMQQAEAEQGYLAARAVEYTISDTTLAPLTGLLFGLSMVGIGEPAHADSYLVRLTGLPDVLATIAERHRVGIAAGRLPVRDHVEATVAYLDRYLSDPDGDVLRRPSPPGNDREAFHAHRDRLLDERVRPAVAAYRDTLVTEVLPHGRPTERSGLCWLPDGEATYARLARAHTTTDLGPQHWHDTGLQIIAALADEYAEIGSRALGTSNVGEIFTRLRTDPALRWSSGDEVLAVARATVSRAEEAAAGWFGRLPAQRCVVEPVPIAEAPGSSAAFYCPPALDGTRPGIYFANTHQVEERSRHVAEVTAFHEAVPGHHFQLSLSLELTDLPLLRRMAPVTAYLEGWGLYAERLADEMGLYSDDLARLGMLTLDSMRAARLVIDTGLHAFGWTRQQAREYMRANTGLSTLEIDQQTDEYIVAPGYFLSYMAGRAELQRIRADAEARLGDAFDIRAFHDTVLGSGPLPLTVLGQVVRDWIQEQA